MARVSQFSFAGYIGRAFPLGFGRRCNHNPDRGISGAGNLSVANNFLAGLVARDPTGLGG